MIRSPETKPRAHRPWIIRDMLPGLRFLFAASLVCASLLIFGMGAIALLRASHQQFASAPPGPPPEPVFAQAPQTVPSLSMLNVAPREEPVQEPPKSNEGDVAPATSDGTAQSNSSVGDTAPADETLQVETPANNDAMRSALTQPTPAETAPTPAVPETAPAADAPAAQAAPTPPADPPATGSLAMPEDQPVSDQTAATQPVEPPQPVAKPPLPEVRPDMAAIAPKQQAAPPRAKPKPAVKRKAKVRPPKRQTATVEKLPAVTSAPTLGSIFSGK